MESPLRSSAIKRVAQLVLCFFMAISAYSHAVDQCNTTQQCKNQYGNSATDCKNSWSNSSVCMCGANPCGGLPTPAPTPTPEPTPEPTPPPSGDQCNTTQDCKNQFGASATDCKNSWSNNSVCMCGSSPCGGFPTPAPSSTPTATPSAGPTATPGDMLGKFDKGRDIFLAFYDNKPDADDIHSQAGTATLLADRRFAGINFYSVLGAYGEQNAAFLNSSTVMDVCFGSGNWTNAHPQNGANWTNSVNIVVNKVVAAIQGGGDAWIMEAGQSDFSADVVRAIKASYPGINTNARIHIVQHSDWNEDKTTDADLAYVRNNADYNRIPDGNASGNGSPQFKTNSGNSWNTALNDPYVGSCWAEARSVANANNYNGGGHWQNPAIAAGGFDFSDVVEATWIFGFNSLSNVGAFFSEFPKPGNGPAPTPRPTPAPTTPPESSGVWQEQDGIVVVEMESTLYPSGWQQQSGAGSLGAGYLQWMGGDFFNAPGQGVISLKVNIRNPGTYQFIWRSSIRKGNNTTEHNDTWLKILGNSFFGKKGNNTVCPIGKAASNACTGNVPAGSSSGGWFKIYRSGGPAADFIWHSMTSDNDAHPVYARFDSAGEYEIQISGRSDYHAIDRFVLFRQLNANANVSQADATSNSRAESAH